MPTASSTTISAITSPAARIGEVVRHYIQRTEAESKTKTEAEDLLGLSSRQTFNNWKEKYKV